MTKHRILTLISATLIVGGILLTVIHFQRFRPLVADTDTSYLNLNDIGVTVLIGADTAIIVLDIRPAFANAVALINYAMDEHDLVLRSPTDTRSVYVMSQLQIQKTETVHLQDSIRLVLHCKKPM